MTIKTISYGLTINLGNYQTARIDTEASVSELRTPEEELANLRKFIEDEAAKIKSDLTPSR